MTDQLRCRDLPDSASRMEWDLTVAISAAVGVARASTLKVFSRYSQNNDALDFVISYEGRFYEAPAVITWKGHDHLQAICDLTKRLLEPNQSIEQQYREYRQKLAK